MKKDKKHLIFYMLTIVIALAIICTITVFYIRRMNWSVSNNIINSINELAEHDKMMIQSYIDICWEDLFEISERFASYGCRTIEEIQVQMNLECATSRFRTLYLLAEDGTVYTNTYVTFEPGGDIFDRSIDFLPYFEQGEQTVFARFDDKTIGKFMARESLLYGVRLDSYTVEGKKMLALIGTNDITAIQDRMVIESFRKDGMGRGYSTLLDEKGNYLIYYEKDIYLNQTNNLYKHIAESDSSEMTGEEIAKRIGNRETFGFYHVYHGERKLFYLIPFDNDMGLYFAMLVDEAVFDEQTRDFVLTSVSMLVSCMAIVVVMLFAVMFNRSRTIRAVERERSQKEFLSNMSHEIRTPLNGLIGLNHLISVHIDDDGHREQIKKWLQKSNSTAHYLLSLVNNILDVSKLQAGKVNLADEPLLVSDLVDEVCAMQRDNIESRGVKLILEKDIIVPCMKGDLVRTKQILMNIVGNAAKFTPEGGTITVSVRQEKADDAHVTTIYQCADTGVGISKEYIGKIFDSFSQERNKISAGIKGTGLGMAICKLLISAMGGEICVESELEKGSIFTVKIPSAIIDEIPDSLKESGVKVDTGSPDKEDAAERPPKILVAEDAELNAEVLLEILAIEGFRTALATNGEEAVRLFAQSTLGEFDIILMDMQMPVMDGCTAAKNIRSLDREDARTVLIYACTANTFQEDKDLALSSGMDDFLAKPIDVKVLLQKIKQKKR